MLSGLMEGYHKVGLEVKSTLLVATHRASASHSMFCYFTAGPAFCFDFEGFVVNFLFVVFGWLAGFVGWVFVEFSFFDFLLVSFGFKPKLKTLKFPLYALWKSTKYDKAGDVLPLTRKPETAQSS